MVGGRRLLLSIAALSGAGFNNSVEAARFRRQDGGGVDVVQNATTPISEPTTPIITSSPGPPPSPIDLPGTPTTFTTTKKVPPIGPPRPGVSPASIVQLDETVGLEEDEDVTIVGGGLLRLTVASDARPTPAEEEYVYPGAYGSDGTLTTDTNAFTRTVLPTRISVVPNLGTVRGPPPVETTTSIIAAPVRTPPSRPPVIPAPVAAPQDEVQNVDLGSPAQVAPEPEEEEPAPAPVPVPGIPGGGRPAGPPVRGSTKTVESMMETTFDLGFGKTTTTAPSTSTWNGYSNSTLLTSVLYPNRTTPHISTPTTTLSFCQSSDRTIPPTVWSIVYTSTLTWYGNPEDYTPQYPPISTPPAGPSCVESPPRWTISHCTSTGTGDEHATCVVSTSTADWVYGPQTSTVPNTVTFVTTDKNPAVVFTSMKPPNYGVTQPPRTQAHHESLTEDGAASPISTPSYGSEPNNPGPNNPNNPNNPSNPNNPNNPNRPQPIEESRSATITRSPVTVVIQPTAIVINDNTIKDNTTKKTQVVIVSGETFTIDPTKVVGADTTIDRVTATGGGVFYPPTPTTTSLRGVEVVLTSSLVLIGGSTYTLSPTSTIAVVKGETFTIGPTAVAAGTQTFNLPSAPVPTEVIIVGGELITAIGPTLAIISGTTITYGNTVSTTTIGDDIITFGPGGVTAHGTITLGGTGALPGETQYVVAGGATITKIGASVVVVKQTTYTIGPASLGGIGEQTITTTVSGEVITIGPEGVVVGTTTMGFPFGPTMVITPGARASDGAAAATGVLQGEDEEDGAVGVGISQGVLLAAALGWLAWMV
ncbi:hypothetical protein QBC36DRAFT_292696 [Triangularia setosa]|uniref:Uncharacterized protein n=1 Tax=Triangularia setosa TaxID=2587417 RepID=A0AAN7A5M3_9PEZI|nr:hypothetical protein QBC36DRAFT_292696 [Podospora setosa]